MRLPAKDGDVQTFSFPGDLDHGPSRGTGGTEKHRESYEALIADGALTGGDGHHVRDRASEDRPSAIGRDLDYRLTDEGAGKLTDLGVDVDRALAGPRAPIRYCVDWSEQDHHLGGALGAALAARLFDLGWVKRLPRTRAVLVTDGGRRGLGEEFDIEVD